MGHRLDIAGTLGWIEGCLLETARDPQLLVLSFPVQPGSPTRALSSPNANPVCLWQPSVSEAAVGWGASRVLVAEGPRRFERIRQQAAQYQVQVRCWCQAPIPTVRWYGGFAFAPGQCVAAPWSGFGDAQFVLPRIVYHQLGDDAWMVLAVEPRERQDSRSRAVLLGEVAAALKASQETPAARVIARSLEAEALELDASAYTERVREVQRALARGEMRKVVTARRLVVGLSAEPDFASLVAGLRREADSSILFAFRFGSACFVGASPERLIRKTAAELETEAVAGSAPAGAIDGGAQLLASAKNRWEHQLVVEGLCDRLAPLCDRLEVPRSPGLRTLSHVLHLWTHLPARLCVPLHVLELVERLHPSAAVGGVPTERAFDWIVAHEPCPRGWYAGPVGWFDQHGDGDFAVALRSGVVQGTRGYLYAGAGIVPQSRPDEELRETELKLSTLGTAWGLALP